VTERPEAERTIPGLTPCVRRRLRALFRLLGAVSPPLAARLAVRLFTTPRARTLSPQESQFLQQAQSRRLAHAGGDIQVYEWAGAGPTVLILHGWISHAARLRETIEALSARGLRVLAFDAPAHGRSSGRRLDLHVYRDAVAAVSTERGPVAAVVAHSFGALTALHWLAENREPRLRAAVLVGVPRDVGYLFDSFTTVLGLSAQLIEQARALFRKRYGGDPESYCAKQLAARIELPVLLVHGGADELVPSAHSTEVAQTLAGSRVLVVPAMSHGGPLRDPDTVGLMADFIAEHLRD
jgi:pimeloyl-ACP methyl ester carboxylesterase